MKWRRTQSEHVDDLRGRGGMGRGMGVPLAAGGGLVGIIALLIAVLSGGGGGLGSMIDQLPGAVPEASSNEVANEAQSEEADFVEFLTEDTQAVWAAEFQRAGRQYQYARLNMFTGQVNTGCGPATSAVGPFYCPADAEVYIDLDFFRELSDRFGAPGDFAQAYVIAHEIGHHVQNLLGISDKVHAARGRVSETEYNQLSVRLELQADFFAGVWAHHAERERQVLETGDIEEALDAASAIGDDRLQKEGRGYVTPDSFTHGTSAQRVRWFRKGLETGDLRQGDTFKATSL